MESAINKAPTEKREKSNEKNEKKEATDEKKERERSASLESSEVDEYFKLQPVVYKGTVLKLPCVSLSVAFKIIKYVYAPKLTQIKCILPDDMDTIKENNVKRIKEVVTMYNRAAKQFFKLWEGSRHKDLGDWSLPYCTHLIAIQITNLAYECAVPCPSSLNSHYKSFSSETYGETNLDQMSSILNELNLGPNDVFVDLGSGVGQLVVFVAAAAKIKKAVGIELSALPARHASEMSTHFKSMMSHFGKAYSPFEIHRGDFMDQKFRDLITKEATVIFVNNFAFLPDLTLKIKNEIIGDLEEGVRIISTKEFGDLKQEINDRTCRDNSSILVMRQLKSIDNGVSWTANTVNFWLHTVDRRKLTEYYFSRKERKNGSKSSSLSSREGSLESRTSASSLRELERKELKRHAPKSENIEQSMASSSAITPTIKAEVKDMKDDDTVFYGRTTRNMWKAQTGMTTEAKKPEPVSSPKWNEADRDYSPAIKKPRKSTERKKKVEKIPKVPKSEKVHHNQTAASTPSVTMVAAPSSTPVSNATTSSQNTLTTSTKHHNHNHHHQHRKQFHHSGQATVEKLDAETMSAINQLHEKTVASTQKKHPVGEELARGELVKISLTKAMAQQQQQQGIVASQSCPVGFSGSKPSSSATTTAAAISQNIAQLVQPQIGGAHPAIAVQAQAQVQTHQSLPPPQPQPQVIPAQQINNVSVIDADQKRTFMIPPTDPLYDMIVPMYLEMKAYFSKAHRGDIELITSIRNDIEREKSRNLDLVEAVGVENAKVNSLLYNGVMNLKSRLSELDMSEVQEVSELLYGSKQIVAHHKSMTQKLAALEVSVAQAEQKLREHGTVGDKVLEGYDAMTANGVFDLEKLINQVYLWKNGPSVEHGSVEEDQNVISPIGSSSVARKNRPRQRAGTNAKRVGSGAGKSEEQSEEVEREIQQFVQQALKVDNAVKEKERRARGSGGGGNEKISRKGSTNPSSSSTSTVTSSINSQKDIRSGPLVPPS